MLAVALVLLVDRCGLGLYGPWQTFKTRVPFVSFLEAGVVMDRLALRGLTKDTGRPRVVVLGSSRAQVNQVRSITRGEHARVQMALLRRAARRLAAAGVGVVVVEAPLHPAAARLYDTSIRDEFRAFTASLVREDGVVFVPLEESGPFGEADFRDLTHVGGAGAAKLSRAVGLGVERALDRPARRSRPRTPASATTRVCGRAGSGARLQQLQPGTPGRRSACRAANSDSVPKASPPIS